MSKSQTGPRGPLIICMGPSQLITAIEALRLKGVPLTGTQFVYSGTYNESLDRFFHEVATLLDIEYIVPPLPIQISHPLDDQNFIGFSFFRWLINSEKLLSDHSEKIRTDWNLLGNRVTVISVRHTVENDVVLLSVLKPAETILTADGIVLNLNKRSLKGGKWKGLNETLKILPLKREIWSPSYLSDNVSTYATPSIISTNSLKCAFENIRSIPLCTESQRWIDSLSIRPKSILLLQQFAQSRLMSGVQEIEVVLDLLGELSRRELTPVLIKPHPRDDPHKLRVIEHFLSGKAYSEGYLVPEEFAAVPAETLGLCLGKDLIASLGWTSSALLSLHELTGCKLWLINPPDNSHELARQCAEFKSFVQNYEVLETGGFY